MANDDALTRKEAGELVTENVEHVMLPEMRKRLGEHVEDCPGFENYLEQVQLTIGILHQLAEERISSTTKQELR